MSDAAKDKDDAPKKKGKTVLIVAIAAVLLLGGGGAGAWFAMRGEPDEEAAALKAEEKRRAARVFVTLEPFVVNLADRESERYAQVGIVLEVDGKDTESKLAAKMPAVRNDILLLISSKQAAELTTREGKQTLAAEIALAAARPLGWTPPAVVEDDEPPPKPRKDAKDAKGKKAKKAEPEPEPAPNPVAAVHFASFLVQ